jgi:hypothetical protein
MRSGRRRRGPRPSDDDRYQCPVCRTGHARPHCDQQPLFVRAKRWARFFTIFPVMIISTGCSALQSREEIAWQVLHVVDAAQTYNIVNDPNYREANVMTAALIGENPSHAGVSAWAVGMAAAHAGVTELLLRHDHPTAARWWNYITITEKAATVGHNFYIGVRIGGANKPRNNP